MLLFLHIVTILKETAWFVAYQNVTHNFCVVDVYGNNTLRLQAKDINGNTIDMVSFAKSPEIKQEPVEEPITETEITESESETDNGGGIPGFPVLTIFVAFLVYYLSRKWIMRG